MAIKRVVVQLFTKAQCSLCVPVKEILERNQEKVCASPSFSLPSFFRCASGRDRLTRTQRQQRRKQHGFDLEFVDIEQHKEPGGWWGMYRFDIPVVHINGSMVAKHRLDEKKFLDALSKATQDQRSHGHPAPKEDGPQRQ